MKKVTKAIRVYQEDHDKMISICGMMDGKKGERWDYARAYHDAVNLLAKKLKGEYKND